MSRAAEALNLGSHEHVSLVGGGGKTTLWHAISAGLSGSVVLTTTTKMGADQHRGLPWLLAPSDQQVRDALAEHQRVIVWKGVQGPKAIGVAPDRADDLFQIADHVVNEADGARRRPFKAPAQFEPVVGRTSNVMVSVIGADALGRVIADQCHRPMRVAALAGCSPYERLTPGRAAAVITSQRGALKEKPAASRFAVAVTKVSPGNEDFVAELVAELKTADGSLRVVAFADEASLG